jgi:hypothetical protein
MDEENLSLKKEVAELRTELEAVKEHLKRYTNPGYKKEYYEKNKEAQKLRVKNHRERTGYKYIPTPEKKKAANRKYYLKKKEREAESKKKATENVGNIEE